MDDPVLPVSDALLEQPGPCVQTFDAVIQREQLARAVGDRRRQDPRPREARTLQPDRSLGQFQHDWERCPAGKLDRIGPRSRKRNIRAGDAKLTADAEELQLVRQLTGQVRWLVGEAEALPQPRSMFGDK